MANSYLNKTGLAYLWSKIKSYVDNNSSNTTSSFVALPVGAGCDYYGATAPTGFMFANGAAISRTEYAELFAIIGTTYGAGDGSTTFNLPDKRERVSVMYKSGSTNYGTLGGKVGSSSNSYTPAGTIGGTAITKAQLPSYNLYSASHTHTFTGTAASHTHNWTGVSGTLGSNGSPLSNGGYHAGTNAARATTSTSITPKGSNSSTTITVSSGGSGQTHTHTLTGTAANISTIQPTLICNYIIKVVSSGMSAETQVANALEGSY